MSTIYFSLYSSPLMFSNEDTIDNSNGDTLRQEGDNSWQFL